MEVIGIPIQVLLDTGASANVVSEELVLHLFKASEEQGIDPFSPECPVQLERWGKRDHVTGVAKGHDLEIIGAAVIPITFVGITGMRKEERLKVKIFRKGCSGWTGLILGGPSLEPAPLGLGMVVTPCGHSFQALGLLCPRREEERISDRLDACYMMGKYEMS